MPAVLAAGTGAAAGSNSAAALNVAGQVGGAAAQTGGNILSNVFNRIMNWRDYKRQRKDALADWNMVNAYNSPQSQMQRLEDANLNPALMYGSGSQGGGQAQNVQAPGLAQDSLDLRAADLTNIGSAWYDTRLKAQTLDNLKKDETIKDEQAALIRAQTIRETEAGRRIDFDLTRDNTSLNWDMDARKEKGRQIGLQNWYLENKNAREEKDQLRADRRIDSDLATAISQRATEVVKRNKMRIESKYITENQRRESEARISQAEEILKNIKQDQKIKQFEIDLNDLGVSKGDKLRDRIIAEFFNKGK